MKKTLIPLASFIFGGKVYNRENEQHDGPLIVCCNHISFIDPVFIYYALDRHVYFMAKESLFKIPVLGWIMKKLEAFPVKRGSADLSAVKNALKVLKSERALGIFPEGTRTNEEEGLAAKQGTAMFAYKTKANILPVHIIPRHGKVRPFMRSDIIIGKVIPYESLEFKDSSHEELMRVSEKIIKEIYSIKRG